MKNLIARLPLWLSYALVIVCSIKSLREPDLWWQIRTGEWILDHGQVPTRDIFSMTMYGQEWINIKWGFEVLAALISRHLGPENIFILQIICSVLILFFLRKILQLFNIQSRGVFFVSTVLLLFGIEYRIIGRPEMFSHLFTVVFVYLLLRNHQKETKWIWLIIPLQILWTNMHEAYGIGIVLMGIVLFAEWFRSWKYSLKKPWTLSLITILASACLAINPRGILLLTRPLNIFSQVQENTYTTELSGIFSSDFWQYQSVLFVAMLLAIILYLIQWVKSKRQLPFPLFYGLLLLAFAILAMMAYRNLIFFFLLCFPALAWILNQTKLREDRWSGLLILIGITFYGIIVSGTWYRITKSRDRFGLEVLSTNNPAGASDYILSKGLQSKKCFSDYLSSSYLLWRLQPNFKTYIDLRDLDVFPTHFFDHYLHVVNEPDSFHVLDLKENYDYVVLYRNATPRLHAYLYTDTIYACTFADPVAVVYEKTDHFSREDIFQQPKAIESSSLALFINQLTNPFYRSYPYDELNIDMTAAEYYFNVGRLSLAEKRIDRLLSMNPEHQNGLALKQKIKEIKAKMNIP
ncbi:MAG: hypothetical protein JNJ58_04585 [Chitinophagaceae bacterium]|nr:hypothetical protein [Chitinophagaceae bacterium]